MKALLKTVFLTALLALTPLAGFAATANNIMLVFNGNTEVNRHTYNFIRQEFQMAGLPYSIYATLDPSTVKAGQFKSVVVISTNTTSGVDPTLARFMKSYSAPKELYLVDMLSRSNSMAVTPFTAKSNVAGVDGVSAATSWGRGAQQMHVEWVQVLADYLATK
ncbi:MAG: hypothetical protein WCG80_04685 [Spirochaetales bacterium]